MSHLELVLAIACELRARFSAAIAHRISAHLNAVGVVNEPVEDAVGQRGIADLLVPTRDRSCEVSIIERS